jgi:Ca-activated chloride channel family protein
MRFSHVHLLLLLYGIPVLAFLIFWRLSSRTRMLKRYGDPRLLTKLMESFSFRKRIIKWVLVMVALVLFILTGAGPQWGTKLEQITRQGVDVIFALDVSESMLAEDVKPNRLSMAKEKVSEFLERLAGNRMSLILFAGDAYIQCPPTLDTSTFRLFLDAVDTDLIPVSGTDFNKMLDEVLSIFEKERKKFKALIILSDGEDHGKDVWKKIEEVRRQGTIVHVLGIGTEQGDPIPLRRKEGRIVEYKKDKEGKAVITKVNASFLQNIALSGGGLFAQSTQSGGEIKKMAQAIQKMEKEEFSSRFHSLLEDRFQYPLGVLILVLILECLIPTRHPEQER